MNKRNPRSLHTTGLLLLVAAWPASGLAQTVAPEPVSLQAIQPASPAPSAPPAPVPEALPPLPAPAAGPAPMMAPDPSAGGINPMTLGQQADELRDILPPVDPPFWTPRKKGFAAGAALLVAVGLSHAILLWRKRVVPLPPPPDPAWVALSALRKLEGAEGEALSARDFAAAVAGVLRVFLEKRHGLAAPRRTTEEFLEEIVQSNRFLLPVREQLRVFLRSCDELKFARVHATGGARTELVSVAVRLIEEGLA